MANAQYLDNAQIDRAVYDDYCKGIELVKALFSQGKGKLDIDSPKLPMDVHSVLVELSVEDFNERETKLIKEILGYFDTMSISEEVQGKITLGLYKHGVYKKGKE